MLLATKIPQTARYMNPARAAQLAAAQAEGDTDAPPLSANGAVKSSRLIVKNLPKHVDERKLRKRFSSRGGWVTDVVVKRTHNGESRRFGFIGFRSVEEAEEARRYFDRSFIDTARIVVEFALPREAVNQVHRPWSKYSKGSSAHQRWERERQAGDDGEDVRGRGRGGGGAGRGALPAALQSLSKRQQKLFMNLPPAKRAVLEKDPDFLEFLAVMKPDANSKFWSNDEAMQALVDVSKETHNAAPVDVAGDSSSSSSSSSSSDEEDDDGDAFDNPSMGTVVGGEGKPSGVSDLDFLKRKSKEAEDVFGDDSSSSSSSSEESSSEEESSGGESDSDDSDEEMVDVATAAIKSAERRSTREAKKKRKRRAKLAEAAATAASASSSSESDSDADDESDDGGKEGAAPTKTLPDPDEEWETLDDEGKIMETGRLFVTNLDPSTTDDDLEKLFSKCGEIEEIHVPVDDARRCRGFAFVSFRFPKDALTAKSKLDNSIFQGRLMHVAPGKRRPRPALLSEMDDATLDSMTHKQKVEIKRREQAEQTDNWNTLFMRSDTVASAIADRYGVQKGDVLNKDVDNMAVRLALAETHLITETKAFLEEHGVSPDAFKGSRSKAKRSKLVILVKNLPFDAEEHELRSVFGRFGSLGRVLLPPSKTVALVEFVHQNEAKVAFRSVAYTKFHHVPLYLEWAPEKVFDKSTAGPSGDAASTAPKATEILDELAGEQEPATGATAAAAAASAAAVEEDVDPDLAAAPTVSVYLKNLHFDLPQDKLLEHVRSRTPGVVSVTIARKLNANYQKGGRDMHKQYLSMGFGFAEFRTVQEATEAIRKLDNTELMGHQMRAKISQRQGKKRGRDDSGKKDARGGKGQATTKIIVKNIPFEATSREIRQLFGTFGKIKKLRLPRKFDGGHRGFGFVEFVTKQEAQNAFEAVKDTHLYGRHLVLQWAKEDESLKQLRQRTQRRFAAQEDAAHRPNMKKRKVAIEVDDSSKAFGADFGQE